MQIYIAIGDDKYRGWLEQSLSELGHQVPRHTSSGHELLQWCETDPPDFLFVGPHLSDIDSFELINTFSELRCCPGIAAFERDDLARAKRIMIDHMMGMIILPAMPLQLKPAIYVARRRFEQMMKLRRRIETLRREIYSNPST